MNNLEKIKDIISGSNIYYTFVSIGVVAKFKNLTQIILTSSGSFLYHTNEEFRSVYNTLSIDEKDELIKHIKQIINYEK